MFDCGSHTLKPDVYDITNEISMSNISGVTYVLVEGPSDNRFYKKFGDYKKTRFYPVCGKDLILQSLQKLHRRKNIIGIADADFDNILSNSSKHPCFFLTDTHDIETLIIRTPALEYVLSEYADDELLMQFENSQGKNIRDILCDTGSVLGVFRLLLYNLQICIPLQNLPYEKFIDITTLKIDNVKLINAVVDRSNKKHIDQQRLLHDLDRTMRNNYNCWDICRGHELVDLLFIGIKNIFGNRYNRHLENRQDLETELRLAYSESHFKKTHLYQSIKEWECNNKPFEVFSKIS